MRKAIEGTWERIGKDALWIGIALLFAIGLGWRLVALLLSGRVSEAGWSEWLGLIVIAAFTYWVVVGSLRRTSWAQNKRAFKDSGNERPWNFDGSA